jgi:transposase-like protein
MDSVSVLRKARQCRARAYDAEDVRFGDLGSHVADAVVETIEAVAESEVEQRVGIGLWQRGPQRKDQRNGYRTRTVQLSWTCIKVELPRLRGQGFVPECLQRGARAVKELEDWVAEALVAGVNRASIRRTILCMTGLNPSEGLLRRVCGRLDAAAKAFKERRLTQRYEYLFLDAAYAKDLVGLRATRVCLLTAVGITPDGRKEILGFERAGLECAPTWRGFLRRLIERGLQVSALRLVISDEHSGLRSAVEEVLGDVAHQYCWAHRMRNVRGALVRAGGKRDQIAVMDALRAVYQAPHRVAALAAFRHLKQAWSCAYPMIVASIEEDLEHLLAFFECPELHREYVRTSNPIERLFVELRRARFGAGAFANPTSCDRVVACVYQRMNQAWAETDIWYVRRCRVRKEGAEAASVGGGGCGAEASRYASAA